MRLPGMYGIIAILSVMVIYADSSDSVSVSDTANGARSAASQPPDSSKSDEMADKMMVTGRKTAGKDAAASMTTLSGEQIRTTARTTPLEALSQESGDIYVSSRGAGLHGVSSGASGGIYIRGLGGSPNSQVLMVEDGVPDYQGIFGHPIPDAFSPALIDRTTVIKGGDGVLYGTNAMGGVVVVENRRPKMEGMEIDNDAAYGSFETFRDRLSLLYKNKRFESTAAFSAFSTQGHRDGTEGSSVTGQAAAWYSLSKNWCFSVREKLVKLRGNDPGPDSTPLIGHWFDVTKNYASGRLDGAVAGGHLKTIAWCNIGVHRLYDGFYSRDYTSGGYGEFERRFGKVADITAGIGADHVNAFVQELEDRIRGTSRPVTAATSAAGYCHLAITPGWGLEMTGGGRAIYSTAYGFVPLYKAGLFWQASKTLSIHSRITRNFRQPTFRELYLPYPTANPDLKPEYALNWDGGFDVKTGWLRISSSVYRTWAQNLIKYFGMWPSAEVVNIDHIEIWGVEGTAAANLFGPLSIRLTGSWQDVGRFTKQNPDAKADFSFEWRGTARKTAYTAVINGEWVHGLYMDNYRRNPIKDVFFIDASLRSETVKVSGVEISPYLIVRNILNLRYEYIKDYPMPGINVLAGLRIGIQPCLLRGK
jgi:outer membrane cobalamin receptor